MASGSAVAAWEAPEAVDRVRRAVFERQSIADLIRGRRLGDPSRIVPPVSAEEEAERSVVQGSSQGGAGDGFALFLGSRNGVLDPDRLGDRNIHVVLSIVAREAHATLEAVVATASCVSSHKCWHASDEPGERHVMLQVWREVCAEVSKARGAGRRVVVHCQAGVSRSASAVVAWLMLGEAEGGLGLSFLAACRFVKRGRPVAGPNEGFVAGLLAWSAELRAGASVPAAVVVDDRVAAAEAERVLGERDEARAASTTE